MATIATDNERALMVDTVGAFARAEVAQRVRDYDRDEQIPRDLLERLAELDLFGGVVPIEWGGLGLDHYTFALILEEMSVIDHCLAVLMSMPSALVGGGILYRGTDEQREKYLRPLAKGEIFGGAAITEPRSGTDVAGMETTAERVGDGYVLRGAKIWISNLDLASFFVTFANLDRSKGRAGVTAFIVPAPTAGLELRPFKNKTGFRPIKTGEVVFDECFVAEEQRLGNEGEGMAVAMHAVENGRLAVAARAVGVARGCLEQANKYAAEREVQGEAINSFQLVQSKLTDMIIGVRTARGLVRELAEAKDKGLPTRQLASMAKMYASDIAMRSAVDAMQIHGAYGCSDEYPVSRHFRDAKIFQIVEGSNDLHRAMIAEIEAGRRPNR